MEIFIYIWDKLLYTPLYNLLVHLYNNFSNFNLGVAIIYMTILLRIFLLPFSIMEERRKFLKRKIVNKIKEIREDYKNDVVRQREVIRQYLRKKSIHPWAKALSLSIQALVILVLYYVFVGGVDSNQNLHLLYDSVQRPDFINTKFLWFDLAEVDFLISAITAGYLFAQILISEWARQEKDKRRKMSRDEIIFSIMFPAFTFLALAILPSVKAIFILTSLIISSIISLVASIFTTKKDKQEKGDIEPKKKKSAREANRAPI